MNADFRSWVDQWRLRWNHAVAEPQGRVPFDQDDGGEAIDPFSGGTEFWNSWRAEKLADEAEHFLEHAHLGPTGQIELDDD